MPSEIEKRGLSEAYIRESLLLAGIPHMYAVPDKSLRELPPAIFDRVYGWIDACKSGILEGQHKGLFFYGSDSNRAICLAARGLMLSRVPAVLLDLSDFVEVNQERLDLVWECRVVCIRNMFRDNPAQVCDSPGQQYRIETAVSRLIEGPKLMLMNGPVDITKTRDSWGKPFINAVTRMFEHIACAG